MMMGSRRCIPEGIIEDILLNLPTKSIIRFQIVCKSWLNLIKSRNFANKHLIKCEETYLATFFVVRRLDDRRFLKNFICLYDEYKKTLDMQEGINNTSPALNYELPFSYNYTRLKLVDHCNGITCVMIDSNILLLINPLLNEVKTLPISPFDNNNYESCLKLVGFGFDSVTMDFKVVRTFGSPRLLYRGYHRAEVYNLTTNAWTELNEYPLVTDYRTHVSTFLNGVIHWCVRNEYLDWRMITFNTTTELFQDLELPQGWNNVPGRQNNVPALFVMNQESLAFVSYSRIYYPRHIVNIWTTNNKHGNGVSWTKLYSIGAVLEFQTPICVLCDLTDHYRSSVICDVDSQLRAYDLHDLDRCIVMRLYRPSFLSIHR